MMNELLRGTQPVFLAYYVFLSTGYILLDLVALFWLRRYMAEHSLDSLPRPPSRLEPPISILVPARNEALTLETSVRSLLQLVYPEFEIVVINDGSTDGTMEALVKAFSLREFPEAYRVRIPTCPVRRIYRSTLHPNLRVVDKENGGKADSLNAGINAARYPLVCSIDADSILQRDSLERVARPFLEDPATVAAGGTVRLANGCEVRDGFLISPGMPRPWLLRFQVMEYLRGFLFGRLGWSPMNGLLVLSGTFSLFRKEAVVAAGGYRPDAIGEDMELVVRLHRVLRGEGRPCRVTFVPDPVCWTEAPEDLGSLRRQRVRWQRGLAQSLWSNRGLLFHPRSGAAGWLSFPFLVSVEWMSPVLVVAGYTLTLMGFWMGVISLDAVWVFLFVEIGLGILLSVSALLLEELSFHLYPRFRHLLILCAAALLENLGYRQLNSIWRLTAMWPGGVKVWGRIERKAGWAKASP